MNLKEINWDFNTAGNWPLPIKIAAIASVCVIVTGLAIYYDTMPQLAELKVLETKEGELKNQFDFKQKKAINLQDYIDQLAEIEVSLGEMIKQMPTKAEVASLLIDISQTGLANGLEFKLFQPGVEEHKEFYTELPIAIEVLGQYAQLGAFVSGLASLPRVVTVHNIDITPLDDGRLRMLATVKTYNESGGGESNTTKIRKGGKGALPNG